MNGQPMGASSQEQAMAAEADMAVLDGWMTRPEMAEQIGISVDTLARWETRRIGPPCVRIGRKVYYRVEAFREWLRDQEARKARGGRR
jgi:predicted DNA-binding transcriptional regulator AlpA